MLAPQTEAGLTARKLEPKSIWKQSHWESFGRFGVSFDASGIALGALGGHLGFIGV